MSITRALWGLLIGLAVAGGAGAVQAEPPPPAAASPPSADPWVQVPAILSRIVPPVFPQRAFRLNDYQAVGDGKSDCTEAFRRAIAACHDAGGGHVVVPAGRFLTGPIHLQSNVDLHLSAGAVILFKQDPAAYLPPVPTRYEGNDLRNYSPFIYALDQQNVAVTGKGLIDGQANVRVWKEMNRSGQSQEARLREMAARGVPAEQRDFGAGSRLRPNLIEFNGCKGVLLEGVTVRDGPMWTVHPLLCQNVTIRDVTIESRVPNGDGIDPESCRGVHIVGCSFNTRDDAIALKAGRNEDGRRVNVPCEDVVVQRCTISGVDGRARNGIAIGSEISAGARNVFVEDCTFANRHRGISLKSNTLRGGFIEDVHLRNLQFTRIEDAFLVIDLAFGNERGSYHPAVRGVELRNVTVRGAEQVWKVDAPDPKALSDIRFVDCRFDQIRALSTPKYVACVTLDHTLLNGKLLATPPAPWFDSTPPWWLVPLTAAGACLVGVLAVRVSRRYWWLLLLAVWGLCLALVQLEPSISGWGGPPVPLVENTRVGLAWSLAALAVAVLAALAQAGVWMRKGVAVFPGTMLASRRKRKTLSPADQQS